MDYNVTVLGGRLAATPDLLNDPANPGAARLLVDVKSDLLRERHDLVPVIYPDYGFATRLGSGELVWVVGALQRRFRAQSGHGRLEVVASYVASQSYE